MSYRERLYKNNTGISLVFRTVMLAIAVFIVGVAINVSTLVSIAAECSGKITATTCNVRADASTTSASIGSKSNGDIIKITGQKTGADGYVWYQIYVNATTVGYVRSDLATITEGSPDAVDGDGSTSGIDDSITAVNPVSGTVTGGQAVRVRQDASTSSTIVSSAPSGTTLTVNGTKMGTDNREWYYVEYVSDGKNVKGFIRSDFISLSGDLTPVSSSTDTPSTPSDTTGGDTAPSQPEEKDDQAPYATKLEGSSWFFYDYSNNAKFEVSQMLDVLKKYETGEIGTATKKGSKATVVWLIIFIIIAIAAIAAAAFFYLKLREASDKSAFADAEREKRNRTSNGQKPSNGAQRPTANGTQRPTGNGAQRPTGNGAQRPASNGTQRPAAPGTQRPVAPGTQRPTGNGAQRPAAPGTRPVAPGTRPAAPGTRPAAPGARPVNPGAPRPSAPRPAGSQPMGQGAPVRPSSQPAKSTNMDDDDEFEFGFLNWDNDDK